MAEQIKSPDQSEPNGRVTKTKWKKCALTQTHGEMGRIATKANAVEKVEHEPAAAKVKVALAFFFAVGVRTAYNAIKPHCNYYTLYVNIKQ